LAGPGGASFLVVEFRAQIHPTRNNGQQKLKNRERRKNIMVDTENQTNEAL